MSFLPESYDDVVQELPDLLFLGTINIGVTTGKYPIYLLLFFVGMIAYENSNFTGGTPVINGNHEYPTVYNPTSITLGDGPRASGTGGYRLGTDTTVAKPTLNTIYNASNTKADFMQWEIAFFEDVT